MERFPVRLAVAARGLALATALWASSVAPCRASERDAACAVLPRQELRVRIVLDPHIPQDLRAEVESTVAAVWRTEGLSFVWLLAAPAGAADPTTSFWLRITAHPIGDLGVQPEPVLGVVRFAGDVPRPEVLVSYAAVREWMLRERARRFRVLFFGMSRLDTLEFGGFEVLARRAVAHAAAHEVGHYVLGSKAHDRSGLMRRDLLARSLTRRGSPDLALSPESRRRLSRRLEQGAACASAAAVHR